MVSNTIKTDRLEYVRFDTKYAKSLFPLWENQKVVRYTYMPLMHSVKECEAKIEQIIECTDDDFTNNFVLLYEENVIGIIGAPAIDKLDCSFGFYYQLKEEYWGKGLAGEATEAFKQYMVDRYPDITLKADAVVDNTASLKILAKLGFVQTHIEENGFNRDGKQLNLVHFSYPE